MFGGCQSSNSGSSTGNDKGKGGKGKGGGGGGQTSPQVQCEDPDSNIVCVEASNTALHRTCALPGKKVPTDGFGTGNCRPGHFFLHFFGFVFILRTFK